MSKSVLIGFDQHRLVTGRCLAGTKSFIKAWMKMLDPIDTLGSRRCAGIRAAEAR
jgi:hypothetical protein